MKLTGQQLQKARPGLFQLGI